MDERRFTDEQMVGIRKEAERTGKMSTVVQRYAISRETCYRWHRKYSGPLASDTKRPNAMEEVRRRPKCAAADRRSTFRCRTIVAFVAATSGSERGTCRWLDSSRAMCETSR